MSFSIGVQKNVTFRTLDRGPDPPYMNINSTLTFPISKRLQEVKINPKAHFTNLLVFFVGSFFFLCDKLSKLARIYLGKKFEPKKPTRVNLRTKCKNVTMEVEVDFMCSWQAQFPHHNSAPVDGPLKCLKSGWQRLRQGTNGVRRKVWIRKISSFVVIWAKNFF